MNLGHKVIVIIIKCRRTDSHTHQSSTLVHLEVRFLSKSSEIAIQVTHHPYNSLNGYLPRLSLPAYTRPMYFTIDLVSTQQTGDFWLNNAQYRRTNEIYFQSKWNYIFCSNISHYFSFS